MIPRLTMIAFLGLAMLAPVQAQERVVVDRGSAMRFLANGSDPGVGLGWTAAGFDDAAWPAGVYGAGYDTSGAAANLIDTVVPVGTLSLYTRVTFTVDDASRVQNVFLGADHDDGFVAWINGVEVYRSSNMPPGPPAWDSPATSHESSNGVFPTFDLQDISTTGVSALQSGLNVLAIGAWNTGPTSTDMVLVPQLVVDRALTLLRGPYLQRGSSSEVTVRWRTSDATDSRVDFGTAPGALLESVVDAAQTTDHEVTLSGLDADTRYFYAAGDSAGLLVGDDDRHHVVTPPPVGASKPTRVWVLGDSGTADTNAATVRDAYLRFSEGTHTDLWLMLGDNAYATGTDAEYQSAVFEMYPSMLRSSVLWPTLGNHDSSSDSDTQSGPYFDIFTLPDDAPVASMTEAYYAFDYGNIHFVVLDSFDSPRSGTGAMASWLELDLAATTQDWIVAYWHHPPYSRGSHDSDLETPMVEMRENFLPILEDHGVDLVLSGHSHSYERSFLLDGHYGDSSTLLESMKLDGGDGSESGDGAYQKLEGPHEGAVYAVAGSSGKISGGPLDHPAMFVSLNSLGSMVLDFDAGRLDARFLDATGTMADAFTLIKDIGCPDDDGDGVCNDVDNCPDDANPDQQDGDLDGIGDVCDPCRADPLDDIDGDGWCADEDNCPHVPNPAQSDRDGDGIGDLCDPCPDDAGNADADGDGIPNVCDCAPNQPGVASRPTEVEATLRLAKQTGVTTLGWSRAAQGHVSDVYRRVLFGPGPGQGGSGNGLVCFDPANADTQSADDTSPPAGALLMYLVGGRNVCGPGPLGGSDAGEAAQPCPAMATDSDGDGVQDLADNCPETADPLLSDRDLDFVGDACDNCPDVYNPDQADSDGNGQGDACQ